MSRAHGFPSLTPSLTPSALVVLAFAWGAIAGSGCTRKSGGGGGPKGASGSRGNGAPPSRGAGATGAYAPEDLAVLFPIDRAFFSTPFASEGDLQAALRKDLVPLSAVVDEPTYARGVAEMTRATTETNALAEPTLAAAIAQMPLAQWFIAGARFVPCGTGRFGIPAAWNRDPTPGAPGVLSLTCTPHVQLSIQRFARMTCVGCDGKPTSDDKALHLILEYHGGIDETKRRAAAEARKGVNAALGDLLGQGKLDFASATAIVNTAYASPETQSDLAEIRARFFATLDGLRDAGAGGPLRLAYGAHAALPRYRAFLEKDLLKNAEPRMLTHNFSLAGLEPGFGEKWIFGRLAIDATAEGGPSVRRLRVDSLVVDDQGIARVVSAGEIENLTDTQGSKTAIDRDLRKSVGTLPLAAARDVFLRTALQSYGFVKDAGGKAEVESMASEAIGAPDHLEAMRQGNDASLDVAAHDITSPSCVSCHITTSVRIQRGLSIPPGGVTRDDAIGLGNMDMVAVGPNTKLTQVEFKQTWLLRAFGYAGQAPSIADRVVKEVEEDLKWAHRFRPGAAR